MNKSVSVVIVHWNNEEFLKKQLNNLTSSTGLEIIVVDNASKKNLSWIKKDFPSVRLMQNNLNRGYAAAGNRGALQAKNDWLLFLNPDVDIKQTEIEKLLNCALENNFDALSPDPGSSAYQKPLPSWFSLLVEFSALNKIIPPTIFEKKTLFGGCLLVKKEILLRLGGWDERFFLWFEDADLTKRLIDNGRKIGWAKIKVNHSGGEAFKKIDDQTRRDIFFLSMQIFAKKHFSFIGQIVVEMIKNRFTQRKLLPQLFPGISLTIPNLKKSLLTEFFSNNLKYLTNVQEIIIVTSDIKNGEIWNWRRKYPEVRFIPISNNRGFASTVNIGFLASSGQFLATVNDDVMIQEDWTEKCLKYSGDKIGSLNPVIFKFDGTIEGAGSKILPCGKAEPSTLISEKNIDEVDATNAAAVIYCKKALADVGLFDEKFGSYLEDIDLSLRLKRSGYKNIVVFAAKIKHKGQSSSITLGAKKNYYDFKNWILVILKNWGFKKIIINLPSILLERIKNISGILKSI